MANLVPSKIPKRATTQVIMGILDDLLDCMCRPLFEHCGLFREKLLQLVFDYSGDVRKRFGSMPFFECAGSIIFGVEEKDYVFIKEAKLDRSLLCKLAKECIAALSPSVAYDKKLAQNKKGYAIKQQQLAFKVGCNINKMAPLVRWCGGYSKHYDRFLVEIYRKYEKLVLSRAGFSARNSKMYVDKEHLESNLKMAVGRAIDRCDVEKGTLTHMVEKCIMTFTNNPEFGHLYNIAFSVPPNVRRRKAKEGTVVENYVVSLDAGEEEAVSDVPTRNMSSLNKQLVYGLQKLRGTAITHLVMGLPIVLSEDDKNKLMGVALSA